MKKTAKTPGTKAGDDLEIDPAFAPVVKAFAQDREVTCGKMMASVGLKVRGKIFAMMVKGSFVAKLPKERVDALVAAGTGARFDPGHGRVMKEWVAVAPDRTRPVELAREAYAFVKGGSSRTGGSGPAKGRAGQGRRKR